MYGAQRLSGLNESIIREMTRLAIQQEAINLSQGFPDFDPPQQVVAAAMGALQGGYNQYSITWGLPSLRNKIAEKFGRLYDLEVNPNTDIAVTCGVTEAMMAALLGLINTGDRVIIIEPFHENFQAAVLMSGGQPLWVSLSPPEFKLDEPELRAAFAQRPKAIIVNTPHNPTGRVFSPDMLALIAKLCIEFDVIAITDEIYEHILYDGRKHIPLATLPGMAERTITLGGLTKTYAATGWRVAWAVAKGELAKLVRTAHDFLTVCAPTPLQEAASAALSLPEEYYTQVNQEYHARRDKMMGILEESGFQALTPEGAYYVMADYSAIQPDMDDFEFAHWLLKEKKVAVVPGSSFYRQNPELGRRVVRFAFAKKLETLEDARRQLLG